MKLSCNTIQALVAVCLVGVIMAFVLIKHKRTSAQLVSQGVTTQAQIVAMTISPEKRSAAAARGRTYVEEVCRSSLGRNQAIGNSFGACLVDITFEFSARNGTKHRGKWNFQTRREKGDATLFQ